MAEDLKRSAEIRRMATHKVAVEVCGPAPAKLTDAYKAKFLEVVEWLDQDVVQARKLASDSESDTLTPSANGGTLSLDESIKLTDWLREKAAEYPELKQVAKLTLISLGVRNPTSLDEAVSKLTTAQAEKLKETIESKIGD